MRGWWWFGALALAGCAGGGDAAPGVGGTANTGGASGGAGTSGAVGAAGADAGTGAAGAAGMPDASPGGSGGSAGVAGVGGAAGGQGGGAGAATGGVGGLSGTGGAAGAAGAPPCGYQGNYCEPGYKCVPLLGLPSEFTCYNLTTPTATESCADLSGSQGIVWQAGVVCSFCDLAGGWGDCDGIVMSNPSGIGAGNTCETRLTPAPTEPPTCGYCGNPCDPGWTCTLMPTSCHHTIAPTAKWGCLKGFDWQAGIVCS